MTATGASVGESVGESVGAGTAVGWLAGPFWATVVTVWSTVPLWSVAAARLAELAWLSAINAHPLSVVDTDIVVMSNLRLRVPETLGRGGLVCVIFHSEWY
jgi:hypothetical protein